MTPYQEAQIAARKALGRLTVQQLRSIRNHLDQYVDRVLAAIGRSRADLNQGAQELEQLRVIVQKEVQRLSQLLENSIATGRDASFQQVHDIWRAAGSEYSKMKGVQLPASLHTPPITLMGAWESLNTASTWKTLIKNYAGNAAAEANQIIRSALTSSVPPDELARRLRKYVTGAETFQQAFSEIPTTDGNVFKLDLRTIPAAQRGAAQQMVKNAERIAFTELHNARAEAEVQHYYNDPFIGAVKWELAPDRGTLKTPDECDYLAHGDFYGMGRGVYPIAKVPAPPHPWDRCERRPIARPTAQINEPKATPTLQTDPRSDQAEFPREQMLTAGQLERAKNSAWNAVRNVPNPTEAAPKVMVQGANFSDDEIRQRFAEQLAADPEEAVRRYNALKDTNGGRILNTDVARELSPDYLLDRTRARAVHEPASSFIKDLYKQKLEEPVPEGDFNSVLFSAGGTGAGKSTAISSINRVNDLASKMLTYDTNMASYASAKEKIDMALEADRSVTVVLVQRDPIEAFVNGTLPRAMKEEAQFGSGRTIPITEFVKTYSGSAETVPKLAADFADNPRVNFIAIDNTLGFGNAREMDLAHVGKFHYNDMVPRLRQILNEERAAGRISEAVYRGFLGE